MSPAGMTHRLAKHRDSLDKCVRVVVMGAAKVGKSSIIARFIHDTYNENYVETVEELHVLNNFHIDNNDFVNIEVLDTSGSLSFPAMRRLAVASADVILLVFSVESPASFERCVEIRQEIMLLRDDLPILIVANRIDCDTTQRLLDTETIKISVDIEWNNAYVEVSAKSGQNVTAAFRKACSLCKKLTT